jgi:hypothetical protein
VGLNPNDEFHGRCRRWYSLHLVCSNFYDLAPSPPGLIQSHLQCCPDPCQWGGARNRTLTPKPTGVSCGCSRCVVPSKGRRKWPSLVHWPALEVNRPTASGSALPFTVTLSVWGATGPTPGNGGFGDIQSI